MSDSIESNAISNPTPNILFRPLFVRRLRHTPMRDLLRGRITDRLDWRGRIAAAGLPAPIARLLQRVVKHTRLWRLEKSGVADELIAHFTDGLASGATSESLVADFGDERAAAKLIRRAKRRNRPLAWHALKWTTRGLGALLALYGVVFLRFYFGAPTVSVDYVAQLNATALATPADQRAWPLYRSVILSLGISHEKTFVPFESLETEDGSASRGQLIDTKPGDADWPRMAAWLDANTAGIAAIRAATEKPEFGFVLGRDGDVEDPAIASSYLPHDAKGNALPIDTTRRPAINDALIGLLLPYLNYQRTLEGLIVADARLAAERRDNARLVSDLLAMRRMAAQVRSRFLIDQIVSINIDGTLLLELQSILQTDPDLLNDAQLIAVAHSLASIGGDTASTVIDFSSERLFFYDIMQRLYTDDGHGDGRLSREGASSFSYFTGTNDDVAAQRVSLFGLASITDARRDNTVEYDHLMDLIAARAALPMRAVAGAQLEREFRQRKTAIENSPIESVRLLPLRVLVPSADRACRRAERLLGDRDGLEVGLALELYRRRHDGHYPTTLSDLAPELLPRVPVDRITGDPIHYRLIDAKPVVYSVGVDRDDDGGRAALDDRHEPDAARAARWPNADDASHERSIDGDWIVFDGRRSRDQRPTTTPTTQPAV